MIEKLNFIPRIIDGGTGTELERLGAPMNTVAWSAEAVLSNPELLRSVHQSFLDAGAELLIANTFSAAIHNLEAAGLADKFEKINHDAVRIVRELADSSSRPCLVAGAISSTTFSGPLDYSRLLSGEAAVAQYARQAEIQVKAGAELMILEMMRDIEQTRYALEGALRVGVPVWVGFTCFTGFDGQVYLLDTDISLERALRELDLSKAASVGIMHTLIEHTMDAVEILKKHWSGHTFAYPHAGRFEMPNWIFQDAITPENFAGFGKKLLDSGIDSVGGCCGITPDHIRAFS
ncbi:homocysteine S-methyltransferase family protein [Desulfovibrio sp. JC010]|uniref:homocysteine S-methyltransferase family protein n=1 Tax=Desulfovibrio sp. JC010 TaxID=2593641 RepID=UPI0013D74DFA|nr:homocysteine S-methyltransferase family protein [Desulfovibrio sp. JC010]NDV25501.1 homocysteine S-methyltransferase family protein [Desulfovibrio sp. JC010]